MTTLFGDDHLHPIAFHHLIAGFSVTEAHAILQARASAMFHENAQTFGLVILLAHHDLELPNGWFSD